MQFTTSKRDFSQLKNITKQIFNSQILNQNLHNEGHS